MKIRIKEIAKERGFKTSYELAKRSGLKYPTADRAFRNDIKQFTPETLELLCKVLFCTPNDIFGIDAAVEYPSITGEISVDEISPEQYRRLSKAAQKEHEINRVLYLRKVEKEKFSEKAKQLASATTCAIPQSNGCKFDRVAPKQFFRMSDAKQQEYAEFLRADAEKNAIKLPEWYYNKSDLKARGWTDAMIRDLLADVEIKYSPTCSAMTFQYFYDAKKVDAIEKTNEFKERKERIERVRGKRPSDSN